MQTLTRVPLSENIEAERSAPATSGTEPGLGVSRALALLSAGAAALHFAFAPEHLDEDWLHGGFFMVVGWLQLVWALAMWTRPSPRLLRLGVLNSAVIAVWVVSRTVGVPIGQGAGEAEDVAFPDVLATVLEAMIVLGSLTLLVRPSRGPASGRSRTLLPLLTAVAVFAATTAALTPTFASGHGHGTEPMAAGHDHGGAAGGGGDAAGDESASGPVGDGHGHPHGEENGNIGVQNPDQAAELQPDRPLDEATRAVLAQQLTAAREAALRYPTLADAEAAGMFPAGEFTPGAGAHYMSPGGAAKSFLGGGTFDPASPATWLYDGMSDTSKVVGLMWIDGSEAAPDGFAGPNDHWHRHFNTCIRSGTNGVAGIEVPFAADRDVTQEMCDGVNGTFMEKTVWMVHAWVVPSWESPNGVFSHDNPNLLCADGTAETDDRGFCRGT